MRHAIMALRTVSLENEKTAKCRYNTVTASHNSVAHTLLQDLSLWKEDKDNLGFGRLIKNKLK